MYVYVYASYVSVVASATVAGKVSWSMKLLRTFPSSALDFSCGGCCGCCCGCCGCGCCCCDCCLLGAVLALFLKLKKALLCFPLVELLLGSTSLAEEDRNKLYLCILLTALFVGGSVTSLSVVSALIGEGS